METNFNFNSQICTTREQSERLIALGLKKETADMSWIFSYYWECYVGNPEELYMPDEDGCDDVYIPAWSLGRLIKDLMPQRVGYSEPAVSGDYVGYYEDTYDGMEWKYASRTPDMFNNIISTIEWLIKEGYFNKEYLI